MSANRYGNFLTVLLVIIIIAIIIGVGFLIYRAVKNNDESDITDAIANFDKALEKTEEDTYNRNEDEEIILDTPEVSPNPESPRSSSSEPKKQYYQGFVMVGYIEIKKTGIKYPILEKATDKSLETSVAIMYPEDAVFKLNTPGNVVIMGHNYRNGKFFSDNKKLTTGDKITITGYNGTLTYTIYEMFETTSSDTSFITRDTNGVTEISLSTCTDNGAKRLIILAKAN